MMYRLLSLLLLIGTGSYSNHHLIYQFQSCLTSADLVVEN
nr:MAG TPA: hypothetical protein [Caudoviricetes sp.]